ncbi:MAG TPA: hypothetical protein VMT71_13455 [Syntrophorhabdales bacterium]|nr:hypothetical protein [Syntrophorhabdales bacterium]
MTLRDLAERLDLEILTGEVNLGETVRAGYTSDLLSDVIAHAPENSVWVTVQRHINILGVAKLKNIVGIITPRNLNVESDVVERARAEGIALLRSALSAFEITGRAYQFLNKG